ncbi:GDSL-type esterase/lipase family protein [Lacrimispora algidixylanolytica]|uniref:GDSL-type esterase/lipase family protein n=1 Tax=Lacrimispora algidixylanolytica TaxID=94868 RepID=UPI000E753C53|nr:GDSL-type esterase/lipase family protein [Lacrimispora algidixylanolytica]
MKQLKDFKRYRLLALIFVSTLILSSIGFAGKNTVYADNTIDLLKSPQLMVVFEGVKQGKYPWDVLAQPTKTEEVSKEIEVKKEEVPVIEPAWEVETASTKEATPSQAQESNPFTKVDERYFDDALFIGDSRTVGLSEYSNWKNPVYYADVGLTVYHVFDKEIANVNGETMNIDQALQRQKFGKIYIMLGINELGRGTTETFARKYSQVIGRIRELQPDAIIFIEGIMGVSKKKSDSDPIFNNKNIQERNAAIETLADNSSIYYIDVNQVIMDDSGGIPSEYTFDNVHLKAAYYSIWTNYLMEHGVIRKP